MVKLPTLVGTQVYTLLDMYEVAFALTTSKPTQTHLQNTWRLYWSCNKVCHHTLLSTLSSNIC